MSFTDRKPFVVTDHDAKARRGGDFKCSLCGTLFKSGDTARWVYANGTPGACTGNFFVCVQCDGPDADLIERAKESYHMAVALAKRWNIYGPDWEREALKSL